MQSINRKIQKGRQKSMGIISLAINTLIKPVTRKTFKFINYMVDLQNPQQTELMNIDDYIHYGIQDFDYSQQSEMGLIQKFKQKLKITLKIAEECVIKPMEFVQQVARNQQISAEQSLKKLGVDVNCSIFSSENLLIIEKSLDLISEKTQIISHIPRYRQIRYLMTYRMLQKVSQQYEIQLLFGSHIELQNLDLHRDFQQYLQYQRQRDINELKQIQHQNEVQRLQNIKYQFKFYSKFANAGYGDSVYSGKQFHKSMLRFTNRTKEFIQHAQILPENLLYSDFQTTANKPAFCICLDEINKNIVVCCRGSGDLKDVLTDLHVNLVQFSILKNDKTGKQYVKLVRNLDQSEIFNFQQGESTQELNESRLSQKMEQEEEQERQEEEFLNCENDVIRKKQKSNQGESVIKQEKQITDDGYTIVQTGVAHSGMLIGSICIFKEIYPKLEAIYKKYDPEEYNLVITGHSLGGAAATVLSLLFYIQPLKCFEKLQQKNKNLNIHQKCKTFTFGTPPVFNSEINEYMKDIQLYSLVNESDCIPRLSLDSVNDVLRNIATIHQLQVQGDINYKNILKFKLQKNIKEYTFEQLETQQNYANFYKELRLNELNDPYRLLPTGQVFLIRRVRSQKEMFNMWKNKKKQNNDNNNNDDDYFNNNRKDSINSDQSNQNNFAGKIYSFCQVYDTESTFKSLLFSRKMMKFHLPVHYEKRLNRDNIIYVENI